MSSVSNSAEWAGRLRLITPHRPDNLDDILSDIPATSLQTGSCIWPRDIELLSISPPISDQITGVIGSRVTAETLCQIKPEVHAATLAALALEHRAEVVILSHLPYSGYERFGFRVERIVGETEQERLACEAQAIAFWGIDIFA